MKNPRISSDSNIVRIVAAIFFLGITVATGVVCFLVLRKYETNRGVQNFHSIAHYVSDTLAYDFGEKENAVLAMAKNMAYQQSNASQWPNVVVPGFYDIGQAERESTNLADIFFIPFVPPEKLASFEEFMVAYYDSEPAIGPGPFLFTGKGVYSFNATGQTYHDTTGEALRYYSPIRVIAPLFQLLFSKYLGIDNLAVNGHSTPLFGYAIDEIIECSKTMEYSISTQTCASITRLVGLPLTLTQAPVEDFHSALMMPIYLNQNASQLVGIMGGGFNWIELLTPMFATTRPGVDIVLRCANITVTFSTSGTTVFIKGLGDHHDSHFNYLIHSFSFFGNDDGTDNESTYFISMYPSRTFKESYETNNPIYVAVGASVLFALCAVSFLLYDHHVRRAAEANATVLETKRRFVRFISHEIRTPLNAVHLGLEALIAELRRTLETTTALASPERTMLLSWLELSLEMMGNTNSAEEVLDDLLNYDRIEMNSLRLEFAPVDIWEILDANVAASHNQIKQKDIHFSFQNRLSRDNAINDTEQHNFKLLVVVGDAARLAQVMRNLISNAVKFTSRGGSISITAEKLPGGFPSPNLSSIEAMELPRAGSIRISVTDSGAGLSEAQLARICSEGVQFNANELQAGKGSGLGLFITKGIVEQHGGKLTVTSAGIGTGTTFTVELPLYEHTTGEKVELGACVAPTSPSTPYTLLPNTMLEIEETPPVLKDREEVKDEDLTPLQMQDSAPPRRILVVDDMMSNRKMLMRILTTKGYVCEQAEDGQQAIEVYRASVESGLSFYAITMDFEMPVMNGPTATGHLRALGCTIPIIGVTGNMLPADISYFLAQGATEILGKPLNVNRFEELMRKFGPNV